MRCEHCGHEQAEGKFCEACGLMLTRIRVAAARTAPAGESAPAAVTLRCTACGEEQRAAGKFCEKCGMRLDIYRPAPPEPPPVKCPECGLVTSRQICPGCGTRIYVPEES